MRGIGNASIFRLENLKGDVILRDGRVVLKII
jgi:hypothetical protein